MSAAHTYRVMAMGAFVGLSLVSCAVYAWSGPGATPPNGNVEAPVNVGSSAQSKTGGLGVGGLGVFGDTLLGGSDGSNAYLNFGGTGGETGYGFRDNNGTIEFKDSGGAWSGIAQNTSFTTTLFTETNTGGSSKTYTCPAGQYVLSAVEILSPAGSSSCNDTINTNKTSVTYGVCSPVSGQTWKVKIVCGGGSGGGAGISNWSGLASMSNFATITAMVTGASLVDCSSGAGAYYCANSGVTSCPAGMTLVSYSLIASQGQTKDGNYDYHSCAMSSGGLRASLTQPPSAVGNANYVTKCQGLCVLN